MIEQAPPGACFFAGFVMESAAASSRCPDGSLTLSDFQYDLPPELIAQVPADRRDQARLLVLDRRGGALAHTHVHALPEILRAGDLLVVNDTRVIPARLFGRTRTHGAVELLLVRATTSSVGTGDFRAGTSFETPPEEGGSSGRTENLRCFNTSTVRAEEAPSFQGPSRSPRSSLSTVPVAAGFKPAPPQSRAAVRWLCLGRPARRLRAGVEIGFPGDTCARITAVHGEGFYTVAFDDGVVVEDLLARYGEIPLPPYIRRPDGPLPLDRSRYQTIFAAVPGAIAAPTAGLHFTAELVTALGTRGVGIAPLTLHVGPGTFLPVRADDISRHVMAPEWCDIPEATAEAIRDTKAAGGRVVAVGTTTTRALESAATDAGGVQPGSRWADRFIVPGVAFRVVDALFTNFHLPGSTLLMLVSAFAGRERILAAYAEAVRRAYRFYSYGDVMLIQ
jgi:S-adenosylmethionine:tRNA ribosyltransferase-isomerase